VLSDAYVVQSVKKSGTHTAGAAGITRKEKKCQPRPIARRIVVEDNQLAVHYRLQTTESC
jgi:hypothetical protein